MPVCVRPPYLVSLTTGKKVERVRLTGIPVKTVLPGLPDAARLRQTLG